MIRSSTTLLVAFLLLASAFAAIPAFGGTEKASLLADLSTSPGHVQAQIKVNSKNVSDLVLDLVVYRWATYTSTGTPADVKNIDLIISSASAALNNPLINWALEEFVTIRKNENRVALAPADDPRVAQLMELSRQFDMALTYRNSSPIQSVNALTIVLEACQKLQLDMTEARIRTLLGNQYHFDMARYRQAEQCYGPAVVIFSAYDCHESAAMIYDDYGALCNEMARYPKASENYSLAAWQWSTLAKQNPIVSRYREMAGREYMRAGQAQKEAGDRSKALILMNYGLDHLRASAQMSKSYDYLIANLITVARIYSEQNDLPKALDLLLSAERASQYSLDPILTASIHKELHTAYRAMNLHLTAFKELGKHDKVLTDAASAGEAALTKLASPSSDTLSTDAREKLLLTAERGADALRELKKTSEAAAQLRRMLEIYKRSAMTDAQIRCLRSLATIMDMDQMPQESLKARMEAATLAMTTNKVVAAEIVREMVQAFIAVGDIDNALDTLGDLAIIMRQSGNVRGAADVLDGRGTLLASHGRYEDAARDFQEALTKYSTQVGDPWAAGAVCLKLASAMNAMKKPADAYTAIEPNLQAIEARYIDENIDPNSNPERSQLIMSLYKELTVAYIQDCKTDSAKTILAQARQYPWIGTLVTQLKESVDPDIASFAKTVDIVNGAADPNVVPDVPNKQTLLANNWADFSARCRMLHEQHTMRYNALPIDPLELYKSRNNLPKKALVVEYLPTGYSTFAFVCGNGKSLIWELGVSAKQIDEFATSLRKSLKNCEQSLSAGVQLPRINDWREPTFLETREPLVSLFSKLVEPIFSEFTPNTIIMFALPHELDGVPMHAIITSEKKGVPRFLIQDYEVGYLSDGMLGDLIDKDSRPIDPSSDRLAIFADPGGNLSGAREEASLLEKLYFNSSAYIGKYATVGNFVKECNKASILHLAVHYHIDPDPSKFVLQLSADGESNGAITVKELTDIANSQLQLVVLSACESAASTDPLQSGPSYAAEVFSLAGAKSVLGGLWKVSDASASKLMGDFYRSLSRSQTRTGSLRSAQTKMIENKDYAHPFYWACFALYGNPW